MPLTDNSNIQGILTAEPPLWILNWPGGQRCSLVEERVVG